MLNSDHILLALLLLLPPATFSQQPSQLLASPDTLASDSFTILKTRETIDSSHTFYGIDIQANGRTIFKIEPDADIEFALHLFLRNLGKQLLVQSYSGGTHCCYSYWILELDDSVHVLFHSDENTSELGFIRQFTDLDDDGNLEFFQSTRLLNIPTLSRADEPGGVAVFKFSEKARSFRLANKAFAEALLKGRNEQLEHIQDLKSRYTSGDSYSRGKYVSALLDLLVNYIYAGEESQGWLLFDQWYALSDKDEIRVIVKKEIAVSQIYREIYGR